MTKVTVCNKCGKEIVRRKQEWSEGEATMRMWATCSSCLIKEPFQKGLDDE